MRAGLLVASLLMCGSLSSAVAQSGDPGAGALRKGAVELGFWGGGGSGVGHSSDTQMTDAGFRIGKVLTAPHGPGFLRGNLEYASDITPLYLFFQDRTANGVGGRQTVYGGSVSPLVVKWNFTRGRKVAPYVAAEGSAIFTAENVPAGDTSQVNFASGVATGLQVFTGSRSAVSFSAHVMHISNASIGNRNPGVNVAVQFRVGYQWWK